LDAKMLGVRPPRGAALMKADFWEWHCRSAGLLVLPSCEAVSLRRVRCCFRIPLTIASDESSVEVSGLGMLSPGFARGWPEITFAARLFRDTSQLDEVPCAPRVARSLRPQCVRLSKTGAAAGQESSSHEIQQLLSKFNLRQIGNSTHPAWGLSFATDAAAQITLINVTNCGPSSFSAACTIPSSGSGHLLLIGWTGESNAAISSITHKVGDKYAEVGGTETSLKVRHKNWTPDIGYAANGNAGATSVTVHATPQTSHGAVVVWKFSGVRAVSPLDQAAEMNNQGASSTPEGARHNDQHRRPDCLARISDRQYHGHRPPVTRLPRTRVSGTTVGRT